MASKSGLIIRGKELKKLRSLKGYTRKSLAAHVGISERRIGGLENGSGHPGVSVPTARSLAYALGCDISDIASYEEEMAS